MAVTDATDLPTRRLHLAEEDAVLGELDGIGAHHSDDGAARHRQVGVGGPAMWAGKRPRVPGRRIEDAVTEFQTRRLGIDLVTLHLNRSEDASVDVHAGRHQQLRWTVAPALRLPRLGERNVAEHEAGLGSCRGGAALVQRPPGHQGALSHRHFHWVSGDATARR